MSEGFPGYSGRVLGGEEAYRERETEDHVFLLSYSELCQYISYSDDEKNVSNSKRLCYPTEYVKSNYDPPLFKDIGRNQYAVCCPACGMDQMVEEAKEKKVQNKCLDLSVLFLYMVIYYKSAILKNCYM